jgi:hypothetical protein
VAFVSARQTAQKASKEEQKQVKLKNYFLKCLK